MELENQEKIEFPSDSKQKNGTEPAEIETENHRSKPSIFGERRKKVILISISLYCFAVQCAYSMIGPFFPAEAKAKGSDIMVTGLIFAVFSVVVFLFSPVVGIVLPIIGPRLTLIIGLLVEGSCQILFGFLDLLPSGGTFIAGCFIVRIICALGASATLTASMTLLVQNFHDNLSAAQGVMETFFGLGMMAGPPIGGFLYTAGGFKLPFLVLGATILFSTIPIFCALPSDNRENNARETNKGAVWQAIKTPAVLIIAIMCTNFAMGITFTAPTLQGHLLQFRLKTYEIGLMFLIQPAMYAFTSPLIGYIADKKGRKVIMITGGIVACFGYILLGPMPFFRGFVPSKLWLNGIFLASIGISNGLLFVPSLSDMTQSAVRYGMEDNLATHSAISSIFNAMFSIGAFTGPTVGGILVQKTSFPLASGIFGFNILLWTIILAAFTLYERRVLMAREENEETKPMLPRRADTSM